MSNKKAKPILIGIAGGSGAGKTTFAKKIMEAVGREHCTIISQDNYYHDQSQKFDKDGGAVNFDHPDALDFELMAQHLEALKNGHSVEVPRYDFSTHTREQEFDIYHPSKIVLMDGTLIFSQDHVHMHFDEKVFIEAHEELRYERRIKRDTEERGRTAAGVHEQFHKQVAPMHNQFVGPSREHADHLVGHDDFDDKLLHLVEILKKKLQL